MQLRKQSSWFESIGVLVVAWTYFATTANAQTPTQTGAKTEGAKDSTKWSGNLLQNGSFEEEVGWSRVPSAEQEGEPLASEVSVDDQVRRTGTFSARLSGTAKTTKWMGLESEPIPVRAGNTYRVTGWIRTEKVHREGDQFFNSNLYVQFRTRNGTVVLNERSPVRATEKIVETKDWTEVSLQFNAPHLAEFARVGCAMTCTGTAWFDDLGFYEAVTETFNRKESARFELLYLGEDAPSDEVIRSLETYLESTEAMLGVKLKGRTRYFKYPDELKKFAMTGKRSPSHTEATDVHATSWDDRIGLVGALMSPLGPTNELLGRGLSVYCATQSRRGDVHELTRRLAKADNMPPLLPPSDPTAIRVMTDRAQDAVSGSFVGWLIEKFGVPDFKQVYAYPSATEAITKMPSRFKDVYQMSLETLERQWKEFLLADKPKP